MSEDSSSVSIIDRQTAMQLRISPVYPKGWLIDSSQPLFTLEQVDLFGISKTGMGWYKYNNQVSVAGKQINLHFNLILIFTFTFNLYHIFSTQLKARRTAITINKKAICRMHTRKRLTIPS